MDAANWRFEGVPLRDRQWVIGRHDIRQTGPDNEQQDTTAEAAPSGFAWQSAAIWEALG
jgi:hypothetical protein